MKRVLSWLVGKLDKQFFFISLEMMLKQNRKSFALVQIETSKTCKTHSMSLRIEISSLNSSIYIETTTKRNA